MNNFSKDTPDWFKQWAKNNSSSFGSSANFNDFSGTATTGNADKLKKIYDKENADLKKFLAEKKSLVEKAEAEIANKELLISKSKSKDKKRIYRAELAELKAERDGYIEEYTDAELEAQKKLAKQEKAVKIAANNDYIKADLAGKQKINQQRMQDLKAQLQDFETLAIKNKGLTEEETRARDKAAHDLDRLNKQDLAFLEMRRKAQSKNVSLEEKLAIARNNLENRQEAQKKSDATYNADVAAANKLSGDAKATAIAEAGERKRERDEKDDAEYGSATGASSFIASLSGMSELSSIVNIATGVSNVIKLITNHPLLAVVKGLVKIVSAGFKAIKEGVEMYASLQDEYLAKINTRLDTGSTINKRTYQTLTNGFKGIVGSNGYLSQKSIVENLASLVDKGVAYNLEQRTILMSISDRMVSTFNMLDDTLLRLTKLQQADMSVSELGTQSKLTQFLNTYFEDTSYLSEEYNAVNSAITEALSQMNATDMTSYSYNVHKWLGALYSLGMSGSGVEKIAEGLNYLSTGNIDAFNSDDSLRTLFAMASGGSYSDLLVNGVNATNVNAVLNNIVSYLADISGDTNKVTKQVKAGIFGGLSLSDLRAVYNLTPSDIATINSTNFSWDDARSQVNSLLSNVEENTTEAIKISNIIDNTLYNLGETLVNSEDYKMYVAGDKIGGLLGSALQGFTVLKNLSGEVKTMLKAAGTATGGINEALSTGYWNLTTPGLVKSRGESYSSSAGILQGISTSSTSYSNYNDTSLNNSMYKNATTVAVGNYTDTSTQVARDINDLYIKFFEEKQAVRVVLADIEQTAQDNLSVSFKNHRDKLDSINDNITTTRSRLESKLTNIYDRQGRYSVGL